MKADLKKNSYIKEDSLDSWIRSFFSTGGFWKRVFKHKFRSGRKMDMWMKGSSHQNRFVEKDCFQGAWVRACVWNGSL